MFARMFLFYFLIFGFGSCSSFTPQMADDSAADPLATLGTGYFQDFAWSPDGRVFAVASTRGIWLYSQDTAFQSARLLPVEGGVYQIKFSASGNYIASIGADGRVWDLRGERLEMVIYERDPYEQFTNDGRVVQEIYFSPDEAYVAAVGYGIFSIWDLNTAQMLSEREGGRLRFTSDRDMILFSRYEDRVEVLYKWDIQSDEAVYSFPLEDFTELVEISADGQAIIITFDNPNTGEIGMQFVSLDTGEEIERLDSFEFGNTLAFSPVDNQTMAFVDVSVPYVPGYRAAIILWDLETDSVLQRLSGLSSLVTSIAFSPDGHYLASAEEYQYETSESRLRLWDTEDGSLLAISDAFVRDNIGKVAFSPDGQLLASLHSNGVIHLWSVPELEEQHLVGQGWIDGQLAIDGSKAVMARNDGSLSLWNIDSETYDFQLAASVQSDLLPLNNVTASDTLNYVAFSTGDIFDSDEDGRVHSLQVWTPETGELRTLYEHETDGIGALVINHAGTMLAAVTREGIVFWDLATAERLPLILEGYNRRSLKFSPNDDILASGGCGGTDVEGVCNLGEIELWNIQTGERLFEAFHEHTSAVYALDFSADASELYTASGGAIYYGSTEDYSIVHWNLNTGERIGRPALGHRGQVTTIVAQGNYVLSGSGGSVFSNEANIRLWDSSLQPLAIYDDRAAGIASLAFQRDETGFVSLHSDGTVRFWTLPNE